MLVFITYKQKETIELNNFRNSLKVSKRKLNELIDKNFKNSLQKKVNEFISNAVKVMNGIKTACVDGVYYIYTRIAFKLKSKCRIKEHARMFTKLKQFINKKLATQFFIYSLLD